MRTACSAIELLEPRVVPSIVMVTLVNGLLSLSGDAGSANVTVSAIDGKTIHLSGDGVSFFSVEGEIQSDVVLTGLVKSLSAKFLGGDDKITLNDLRLPGDVNIELGDGENSVAINTLSIKGGFKVTGGAGADEIIFAGESVAIKKSVDLLLGNGSNSFRADAANFTAGGALTYAGGTGDDRVAIKGRCLISGAATFTLGSATGVDQSGVGEVRISGASFSVGKALLFDAVESSDTESVAVEVKPGSLKVGTNLQFKGGAAEATVDIVVRGTIAVGGTMSLTGGNGSDNFSLGGRLSAKQLDIDVGGGLTNVVSFGITGGAIPKGMHVKGGDGNDNVNGAAIQANWGPSSFALKSGANDISVQLIGTTVKGVSLSTTETAADAFGMTLLGGKIAGNVEMALNGAIAATVLDLSGGASITGLVSVVGGPTAGESLVGIQAVGSSLGGLAVVHDSGLVSVGFQGSELLVKGAVQVRSGEADDRILLNIASLTVSKGMKLELGSGDNVVTGEFQALKTKSFSVTGGNGEDLINLLGTGKVGAVSLDLGAGKNTSSLVGFNGTLELASLALTSAGEHVMLLRKLQILGATDIALGATSFSSSEIESAIFGGIVSIETGAGGDLLDIDVSESGAGTFFKKAVTIALGAGDDTLRLGALFEGGGGISTRVVASGAFVLDGGDGTDTLIEGGANVYAKAPTRANFP